MTPAPPIRAAPYAGVPDGEMLFIQRGARYASQPPATIGFSAADPDLAREFAAVTARPHVDCPPEAVMLYRDAIVLDGSYILGRDGTAVAESYYNVKITPQLVATQHAQLARIAAGDIAALPAGGPPVVALFLQDCNNFGHVLAEHLPRLLHLAAIGLRRIRLLLPAPAEPLRPQIGFVLHALGIEAELVPCPIGAILRVPALHFVSLVGGGWFKSPTVRRMFDHLRAAAPPPSGPARLYVPRPDRGRRVVTNAARAAAQAQAAGFTVVAPQHLPLAEQIALFAGARAAIGPMGAALTLTGAMAPGGRVGILGPGYCDYFYWDLACLAGLDFDWAFTAPAERFRPELLEREMTVPPAMLQQLLDAPRR